MFKLHVLQRLLQYIPHAWRALFRPASKPDLRDRLTSGLPDQIDDSEKLARFLKQSNQFSIENEIVKYAAFLPNRQGQSSVFRHSGEPPDELWEIGSRELGENTNLYGAGIVSASGVRSAKLEVIASEPPPRHANIEAWLADADPNVAKAARVEAAKVVAAQAKLLLR